MLLRLARHKGRVVEKSKVCDAKVKAIYLLCYNSREKDGVEDVYFVNYGGVRRPYPMSMFIVHYDGRVEFWYEPTCRLTIAECVQRANDVFAGKVAAKSPYFYEGPSAEPVPLAG